MPFKDYFSAQAGIYAQARPSYPDELFEYLAGICVYRERAWDCATGNGQAAVSLAKYFDKVIATDASAQQIEKAVPHEKVEYRVAPAEKSGLPDSSIDLITVATAIHWFDHAKFYQETNRVLKPRGILAAWTYSSNYITPEIDLVTRRFIKDIIGPYWPEENIRYSFQDYRTLPFPYTELETPAFETRAQWNLRQLLNYFMSWSGTQNYIRDKNANPIDLILPELEKTWGDPERAREVTWPLHLKVGRK